MTADLGPDHRPFTAIVLAAGKGTRMRSDLPKVLHRVAGRTMLGHVLAAVRAAGAGRIGVVVEPGQAAVETEVASAAPGARVHHQAERLGTAHAVLAARETLAEGADDVIVAFGDTPLVTAATLTRLRAPLGQGASVAVLGFRDSAIQWVTAGSSRKVGTSRRSARRRMPAPTSGRSACAMPA